MSDPELSDVYSMVCQVSPTSAAAVFDYPLSTQTALLAMERRRHEILDRIEQHAWEGAGNDPNHGKNWLTSRLSANADLETDLDECRQRSRYLYRNDAIGGAVDDRKNHVVGTGFTYLPQIRPVTGWITQTQADVCNEQLEEIHEGLSPCLGASGNDSLLEQCRLVEGHHGFDGESITLLGDLPMDGDKPLPMVTEVIDPMRMETPPDKLGDPDCKLGVQHYPGSPRIKGYWIQTAHPGETKGPTPHYEFYPRERVIHIFEKFFAGQSRGLAWLARTLYSLQNRKDLTEAGIIRAQVEACFIGFLKQTMPEGLDPTGMAKKLAALNRRGQREFEFHPGTYGLLGYGEEFQAGEPPTGLGSADALNMTNDRRIAAALGMAYEMLARDWRGVSFAGGRIILSGVKLDTETRQERIATRWLAPIAHRMVDEAVLLGKVDIPALKYGQRPLIYRRHEWIPQAWPYSVAPGEEVDALLKAVDGNLLTKAKAEARYSGGKWNRTKRIRQAERKDERDLDIVPPTNAQNDEPTPQNVEQQNEKIGAK